MEGPISFWGYKEQESNLILPEHDDDEEEYCNLLTNRRNTATYWQTACSDENTTEVEIYHTTELTKVKGF